MRKHLAVLFFMIIIALFYSGPSYPYGVITHIGQAQDIINMAKASNPAIPSDIASIITKSSATERAFRSGALDADIFNALIDKYKLDPNELNRTTHEKCSALIASILLKNAKTDVEKAYAYGWALAHLPGDVIGHPFVNLYAGNGGQYGPNPPAKWDYGKSAFDGTNGLHLDVEKKFDGYVLDRFGYDEVQAPQGVIYKPRLDMDIDIPVKFLKQAIGEAFGRSAEPGLLNLHRAEIYTQAFLHVRATTLIGYNDADDPRFLDNYNTALERIIEWMNDRTKINDNYDLDDGTAHPNDCPQMKRPIMRPGPGGDYPDDTFDVATLQAAGEVPFEDWLRVAFKKGKKGAIFTWQLRNKLNDFESLPDGIDPILREEKRKEIVDFYRANVNNADIIEAFLESNPVLIEDLITVEDVGILDNGFPEEMAVLAAKFKEPTVKVTPQILSDSTKDKKVIIIPSGGLYGFEDSEFFKASLDEYVKQGGTLIVFAQQHGYEFSVLPVPQEADGSYNTIGGYGWLEDQSCFANAAYIDTWHQMLAGQSKSTPTLHLDGYFTTYPSNATVFLRRTANGQPALLMYEYGQGQVIVTSMYSDFALKQNQASSEEMALVRDMISWAKSPVSLEEIRPAQTVSVSVEMVNNTTTETSSAKLSVYNPDRTTLLSEQMVDVSIPAGQATTALVTYTTGPTSALGIYHIDHTLHDAQGNIIQPQAETDSGRFVVSNPPTSPSQTSQLTFSIQSDSHYCFQGDTVDFIINAFNNSNIERTVTAKIFGGLGGIRTLVVPARGSSSFHYPLTIQTCYRHWGQLWGWISASFYEGDNYLTTAGRNIRVYEPYFDNIDTITVNTDKDTYLTGQSMRIDTSLENNVPVSWQASLRTVVADPNSREILRESNEINLSPYQLSSKTIEMIISETLIPGTYTIRVEDWYKGYALLKVATKKIEILQSKINILPQIPAILTAGTNNFSFALRNEGKIGISSGTFDLSLKDPEGEMVYSVNLPLALSVGESKTLDVPITIPPLKLGSYTLTYSQSDETRIGNPTTITIPNDAIMALSIDKPFYRVRETANLTVDLTNTGKFNQDSISATAYVPDTGYSETKSSSLSPNQTSQLVFSIPIPETIASGQHNSDVSFALPSGSSFTKTIGFGVPESSLSVEYSGQNTLTVGDIINLSIKNAGGVDTTYTTEKLSIKDNQGIEIYSANAAGSILSDETKSLADIQIPFQTIHGTTFLNVQVKDGQTGKIANLNKTLEITGLDADLQVRADKEAYFKTEPVTGLSTIVNGPFGIDSGNLNIKVNTIASGTFTRFIPKTGWWPFNGPDGVGVGPDGVVYVADAYNYRIQKFNGNGEFISRWGSYGTEDGQFNIPRGVATGPDGFVYVSDSGNHRIQKFDSSGNFVTKWGAQGIGNSEFSSPYGVAVGADGLVYVVDSENHRIQKFDSNGGFLLTWGSLGTGDGQFNTPEGIAVGPNGSVYVADSGNRRIQKFDSNGNFIDKWIYLLPEFHFQHPSGIAVGLDNFVYVTDSSHNTVQKYNSDGNYIKIWGTSGIGNGQFAEFDAPKGIAVSSGGSIYVADTWNNRIQKFDSDGNFLSKWGTVGNGDGEFYYSSSVAIGLDGSVYVADGYNDRIQKFDTGGNFILKWGTSGDGDGEFYSPEGIAVGPDGSVYVADGGNSRIQKFDSNGNFATQWGNYGTGDGEFDYPQGIAITSDGFVYVADTWNNRIQKFDSNGNFILKWGVEGIGDGEFSYPSGVSSGLDGSVYVVDTYNHRIQKFDSSGNFIVKWGAEGSGDGEFYYPQDIVVGADGSVYVVDTENYRIQRFDGSGNLIKKWEEFYYPYGIAVGPDGSIYVVDAGENQVLKLGAETLFETNIPINQPANTTQDYITNIGILKSVGKLYLQGKLYNSLGEMIAQSSYPFYIIEGDTALLFTTDKTAYRPGETVVITGQVQNRASIEAVDLVFAITSRMNNQSPQTLHTETFSIPAAGSHPFTVTTTADTEGIVTLDGNVNQNNSVLVEIADRYEVAWPNVTASVTIPDVAGNDTFNISVETKNTGKVEATTRIVITDDSSQVIGDQELTTLPGETKLLQYSQQITGNVIYTFTFTGDLEQTLTKTVSYGLGASIALNPQTIFPEGIVAVPVTINNTGQLPETVEIGFLVSPGSVQLSKSYYLPAGASTTDTLYFNLSEGDYQITASSQLPTANFQASFSVRRENRVEMVLSTGAQSDGLTPLYVNLTNTGYNDIIGSIILSANSQAGTVWTSEQAVTQLPYQNSQLLTFNFNPSAFDPGAYTINAQFLNTSGQQIALQTSPLTIQGPVFQIAQVPSYQVFNAGQEAIFVFRVKNDGNQEAAFGLRFKAYDLIELTQQEWLKPGEEKPVLFSLLLPEDLEEKDYFASYELKAAGVEFKGQVKYRVAGINLNVNAALDKQYYSEGETAHLTINIQSPSYGGQSFFTRVNYNGYESQQPFILSGSQALFFDIPLTKITGEKLFYGIYHESGRSIHLNSLYIHKAGELLTITTDKQVYNPSETVTVTINSQPSPITGPTTLTAPGYTETFDFTGSATKSFTLPSVITAGTYYINVQLEATNPGTVTATHPFDVAGIQVKVLECQNDKGKYASSDTITTNFTISSNTAMPAILKAWIVDPKGQYTSAGENNITLASSENLLYNRQSALFTQVSGIHRLVYGIYTGELLLVSGSEAFDVGDAVLLGISTDKKDYPTNTEPVNIVVSLFGSVDANLQLELDGSVVKSEMISLNGYQTYSTQLQNINPGPHTLKGILTAGGLTSTKETSFTYALAYMPKPQISASPSYLDFGGINLGSTSTRTIILSSTGNVDLVIGAITLSGENQGEFSILNDNCSGRTVIPSGNCTLDILFSPGSLGAKSALLSIASNATEMPTLYLSAGGMGVTTLNVSINPEGSGRVTGTGIDCPGDCVETYSISGAAVQLTATPSEGYQFANWIIDTAQTENPITVSMDTHRNVTANFTTLTYTINAAAASGGIISPSGLVTLSHGGNQTFTITPNPGYHVADVKVDEVSMGAMTSYTFSDVTSDHTIEALFAINQYIITATAGPNGTITPSGSVSVSYGGSQAFAITPDVGYHVAHVKVDGASVGAVTTFTFDNVTSNHTIEVTFAIDNSPPVANAGPDQNVITGQVVTLNGSESYDPEGLVITFLWTFVEVPAGSSVTDAFLSDRTSAMPQFTPDVSGVYRLQLIVNDGTLDSIPDEVVVSATTPNVPPNASAGPDQNVITRSTVQLNGSSSSDPDNGPLPLSYLWSFAAKPAASLLSDNDIVNRNMSNASFTPDVDGIYELNLTASDGDLSSEDTVQIIAALPNVPPNANAGADMTISLGGTAVLNGSASNDPDQGPQPLTYLWTFVAVPTGSQLVNGDISGGDTVSPSFTPDIEGTYVLQLMVYDGRDTGFDNVAVTVRRNLRTLGPVTVWLGLINSDDQGTYFDLKVELLKNGVIIASGQTIDIRGITRNPDLAKEATVAFGSISEDQLISGDILSLRIWTKVTASGGHSNAVGLRLYYDAVSRPSRFGAEVAPAPMSDYFLHSDATSYFLDTNSPTSSTAKYKDSTSVNRTTWKEIGTWSFMVQ